MQSEDFIELNRTYSELRYSASNDDEGEYARRFGDDETTGWRELMAMRRVVLLASAGSGKTTEIRRAATHLRDSGKRAFFLRIEHIGDHLEDAFEEGSYAEFKDWILSGEEGWLLLDSVDEAKLRGPFDFELAIRKLGRLITPVLQSAHIIISGRTGAWRARTDLAFCNQHLRFEEQTRTEADATSDDAPDGFDTLSVSNATDERPSGFRVWGLDDLNGEQVETFARLAKVENVAAFLDEVERKDAWSLTSRPQDLDEVIAFWKREKRVGSRLELMESSVERRLVEHDAHRSHTQPLSAERARRGAMLAAAACTLTQESAIRTPDGGASSAGLALTEILADWNEADCAILINRPIFEPAIYGSVRFHHRSVREYLTAQWFASLIVDQISRAHVEGLFFRTQYGVEIIVPALRPILPWLAMRDSRILDRVCRVAPEIILEGGDPQVLPLEVRRQILRDVCEKMSQPAQRGDHDNREAIQRFASIELVADIAELLERYAHSENVVFFLMRMIWLGKLAALKPATLRVALGASSKYSRIVALRALDAMGATDAIAEARTSFLSEMDPHRDLLSEFVTLLPRDIGGLQWLLTAITKVDGKPRYTVDFLTDKVSNYLSKLDIELVASAIRPLLDLLRQPPVYERRELEVSLKNSWLVKPLGEAMLRLITVRHPTALGSDSLAALRLLPQCSHIVDSDFKSVLADLSAAIAAWSDLNYSLFWYDVGQTRVHIEGKGERLTEYWSVGMMGRFWSFDASEWFEVVMGDVQSRALLDDRLVALRLSFAFYVQAGRPVRWRGRLKSAASHEADLSVALKEMFHPPRRGRNWRKTQTRWKKRREREKLAEEAARIGWREYLSANVEKMKSPGHPGTQLSSYHYLYQRMREKEGSSGKWSLGHWDLLIPEFGEEVATAFRDGAVAYWRLQKPTLPSEGTSRNSTSFSITLGLCGLAIEARSNPGWALALAPDEAEIAAAYSVWELNGFPEWLPHLYEIHPGSVMSIYAREIEHELSTAAEDDNRGYGTLHNLAWGGSWMFNLLGEHLLPRLSPSIKNNSVLSDVLGILAASPITDDAFASAIQHIAVNDTAHSHLWFAAWVGVAPRQAIPALAAAMHRIKDKADRTLFAMKFATTLLGSSRSRAVSRSNYKEMVPELKALYLLLNEHIHESEDINRAGTGVYSPELRDDAQDARNALFTLIKDVRGKEAYLALLDCAHDHPSESARPWMRYHARVKAAQDADLMPWTIAQARDFAAKGETTPSNHRELWYLCIDRVEALKYDVENGDQSIAKILKPVDDEILMRNFIGGWFRDRAAGRYMIAPEEELADERRPDIRFHGLGFDGPVPIELKIADKWSGPTLFERLENQLSGDYLRDRRSSRGVFLLVYRGSKHYWEHNDGTKSQSLQELVDRLSDHWKGLAPNYRNVEDLRIIGIDLTARHRRSGTSPTHSDAGGSA